MGRKFNAHFNRLAATERIIKASIIYFQIDGAHSEDGRKFFKFENNLIFFYHTRRNQFKLSSIECKSLEEINNSENIVSIIPLLFRNNRQKLVGIAFIS